MLMVDDFNFREYNDDLLHAKIIQEPKKIEESLSKDSDASISSIPEENTEAFKVFNFEKRMLI